MLHRLHQQVQTLLIADHADISDEIGPPIFPLVVGWAGPDEVDVGPRSNRENALWLHAATIDCDAAVGIVGGD